MEPFFCLGPLVKRLRHRPFTAVTRVRVPYGSLIGELAQLGEHLPYKQRVGGSNPSFSTILILYILSGSSSVVEHHLAKVGVAGSNPVFRSNIAGVAELADAQDLKSCGR